MGSQPARLVFSVPPTNVASNIRLKIPRRNQNNISHTNPDPSLQLPSDSTETFMTILTLYRDSIKAKQSYCYSQHIIGNRQLNPTHVIFADNLSFTQSFSPLGWGKGCHRFRHQREKPYFSPPCFEDVRRNPALKCHGSFDCDVPSTEFLLVFHLEKSK